MAVSAYYPSKNVWNDTCFTVSFILKKYRQESSFGWLRNYSNLYKISREKVIGL